LLAYLIVTYNDYEIATSKRHWRAIFIGIFTRTNNIKKKK